MPPVRRLVPEGSKELLAKEIEESASKKSSKDGFESYVVLEFKKDCPIESIRWIMLKITSSLQTGGGGLLARTTLDEHGKESIMHISASTQRLLFAAELMEMKKTYLDGTQRDICIDDIKNYKDSDDLDNFLTLAEKQRIVRHELDIIRALENDRNIPGCSECTLYKGVAILPKCVKEGIVEKMYPLHDKEALKRLSKDWYQAIIKSQPIDKIHEYFGSTIAMYFAFLGFYTMALVPPTLIGMLSLFTNINNVSLRIFFCVFNLVWSTLFLEAWKRKSATLAYTWGTINADKFEEARPEYYGTLSINRVTGRLEPHYPKWKRLMKFYCVSIPVVSLCLFVAFVMMVIYFKAQDIVDGINDEQQTQVSNMLTLMPTVVYTVVIIVMNVFYKKLARILTEWENHRLQSSFENHYIFKLVLFESINNFGALFYVAFYLQDMEMLKRDLGTLLIITQIINQMAEVVIPYGIYKYKKQGTLRKQSKEGMQVCELSDEPVPDHYRHLAEIESKKDEYDEIEGTLQDYLELYLQYGYVFLFSAAFPMAAFWALINNITEIRSDAFKLCRIFQRPFAQSCSDIGAWLPAFEIMNILAVITNTVLVAVSPKGQELQNIYGQVQFLVFLVVVEHVIMGVKVTLAALIPDQPEWVQTALDRVEYQSNQAWKKKRVETEL